MKSRRPSTEREWSDRVLRVLDFITEHLADDLPLARLARVGAFSPFHFHRVFQAQTGQTVRAFVARKRVERAMLLLGRGASRRRLTDLALELGFSSSAEFSRAFRAHTGCSPSKFRHSKIRKNPQEWPAVTAYRLGHAPPLVVRLVSRVERRIAFVSVTDCFAPGVLLGATRALDDWRAHNELASGPWWGSSSDDPFVTAPELCRYQLGLEVPASARGAGRVHTRTVRASLRAELEVQGGPEDIDRGWTRLFAEWLPGSGCELEDAPGEERFAARPNFESPTPFEVLLSLPVRRR
ncbi:MAG: AraC family transcriptional regulator [Archangium sp.]|nr:AraC family transcriptional regulator [Archangium sp.]MDP3155077.1 AraC family transcriptional regulator [Archangium sp.]MDP3572071.1 AraC family transcriptional regulator [Archangium sp.]